MDSSSVPDPARDTRSLASGNLEHPCLGAEDLFGVLTCPSYPPGCTYVGCRFWVVLMQEYLNTALDVTRVMVLHNGANLALPPLERLSLVFEVDNLRTVRVAFVSRTCRVNAAPAWPFLHPNSRHAVALRRLPS
eukprot:622786-Prorocentrum_minimum.AAC.4